MNNRIDIIGVLENRNSKLKDNHRIGNRDIANQELKEISNRIDSLIPHIREAVEKAKKYDDKEEMNKEIDYKVLYEEAQAKLDKIAYNELKKRIDYTLRIKHNIMYHYDSVKQLERVQENKSIEFLYNLDRDEVQNFINEIGYDNLWAIIKDIYQDAAVNDEEVE